MSESHLHVRAQLLEALRADLIGPMDEEEVLEQRPLHWYLTGFLVSQRAATEDRLDALAAEELAAEGGEEGEAGAEDGGDQSPRLQAAWLPSSMGLSVVVPEGCAALTVSASWGRYHRVEVVEEEGEGEERRARRRVRWRREQEEVSGVEVPLRDHARQLKAGDDLRVQVKVWRGVPGGGQLVSVFLVNDRGVPEEEGADGAALFQVRLRLQTPGGFLLRPDLSSEGSEDPDLARLDLQFRGRGEWAVGHGVSAEALGDGDGVVRLVETTWLPQASVYRMREEAVSGVPLEMEALARLSGGGLRDAMAPMLSSYQGWVLARRGELGALSAQRRAQAELLLEESEEALGRIARGLAVLEEDAEAMEAFVLTQRAMEASARKARPRAYRGGRRPSWRLFQLAFLLLNIEGLVRGESAERERVELLFFPTGGGKTEAYFGVACFAMWLRRLRGRGEDHGGAGVAVLLRYTLRLLTLDQLGRAATLMCAMELERRAAPERLGEARLTVGLWVGNKATPNKLSEAQEQVRMHKVQPKNPQYPSPSPLPQCPWCGVALEPGCYQIDGGGALRIGCASPECAYGFMNEARGLPLVVVDEQIYRELPSFLIGTVDKFAMLPWRGQAGALFGRVRAKGARGFYGYGEEAPPGSARLREGVPAPALVLQDELHLITGPLGTMVGLYEVALEELSRRGDGGGPKIIASTATVRRAPEQILGLYGRGRVSLFPPQGITEGEGFFAQEDRQEGKSRLYVGVAAPGRSMKALAVRVYSALLSAAQRCYEEAGTRAAADAYMTLVAYFNTLRELGGAQRLVQEEVSPRCNQMSRRRPVGAEPGYFADRVLGFDLLELTSRVPTEKVRQTKERLEKAFDSGKKSDVLLASSMISVGVDIARLGLMVVNGQPRTVSEYIQASSRVGREHPGLVVTMHNVYRARDRSHYERYTAFHESFYRHVEASSVTPFSSRALDRGLAGVSVAMARHLEGRMTGPLGVGRLDEVEGLPERVAEALSARASRQGGEVLREAVRARVRTLMSAWSAAARRAASEHATMAYTSWEVKAPQVLLHTATEGLGVEDPEQRRRLAMFRAPTSMRDVEPAVHIWVQPRIGVAEREE